MVELFGRYEITSGRESGFGQHMGMGLRSKSV